jgi:hypothetical protein
MASKTSSTPLMKRAKSITGKHQALHLSFSVVYLLGHLLNYREYLPELERSRAAQQESLQSMKEDSMSRMMKDLAVDRERFPEAAKRDLWAEEQNAEEEGADDDDDDEINIIDRSKPLFFSFFFLA